ncbi:MAG: HlyD family efflux transporter periplasmic adaptor subunit [Pseudomonadota bacterium]|nr:HlyD family efflux transporter periplasmic adaptor subunit [Pseudomonadota bacterium]
MKYLILGWAMLLTVSVATTVNVGATQDGGQDASLKIIQVKSKGSLKKVDLYGSLKSAKESTIHAQIEGSIKSVHVIEGQTVEKGEVLVSFNTAEREKEVLANQKKIKIDTEQLMKSVSQKKKIDIQLLKDKHSYYLAKKQFDKQSNLFRKGIITKLQMEEAMYRKDEKKAVLLQTEYSKALVEDKITFWEAKIELAKTMEAIGKKEIEKSSLKAPYAGTIRQIFTKKGQRVSVKDRLLELYDSNHLLVRAVVSHGDVMDIKQVLKNKADVPVSIIVNDKKIQARIISLLPDSKSDFIGVDILIAANTFYDPSENKEQSFAMWIPNGKKEFDVPKEAIRDNRYVYKVNQDEVIEGVPIAIINRSEDRVTIEANSLENLDRIILSQDDSLKPGSVLNLA